jgi:hypothetical protein
MRQLPGPGLKASLSRANSPPDALDPIPDAGGGCEAILESLLNLRDGPLKDLRWQDFERHCAEVMEYNDYRVIGGIWFKDDERRYQIDLVAVSNRRVLSADCKAWRAGGGAHRSRKAAEGQMERTARLRAHARARDEGIANLDFYPLVVTLKCEAITLHEGVPVVPFEMLNAFLVHFESYQAQLSRA